MAITTKQMIIKRLRQSLPDFPIKKAWLFGSYATNEATENSDVDLLVTYDDAESMTLFKIGRIVSKLSEIVGRKVDVVENGCLLPFAQKSADNTKILIYERDT